MTREEAIKILEQLKRIDDMILESPKNFFAINMAIKALEQEPKTEKVIKMRRPTPEEIESIEKYVKSISKTTGGITEW